jgi:site-specific DNA-methyltransferase (adenine-specific)
MRCGVRIEHGDCIEVMSRLLDEGVTVDAVVTDPPYHLVQMTKRYGKPDAKPCGAGNDGSFRRLSRGFMGKEWDGGDIAFRVETWLLAYELLKPGGHLIAFSGSRTYHRMACAIEDAGFEIRDQIMYLYGSGFPKSHNLKGEWEGWGTALKPAHEPLCLARKPLIGTVAANVLEHGTGALNIDGCRVEGAFESLTGGMAHKASPVYGEFANKEPPERTINTAGRWPANVIHDGSEEVLAAFAAYGERKAGGNLNGSEPSKPAKNTYGEYGRHEWQSHADTGSAARFFYSAKADADDRLGSKHPTVKPVDLMAYLCRLVTPKGGTVLDPFAGSGTTGQAALREGFKAILIERESEYVEDIKRRLAHVRGEDTPLFA